MEVNFHSYDPYMYVHPIPDMTFILAVALAQSRSPNQKLDVPNPKRPRC